MQPALLLFIWLILGFWLPAAGRSIGETWWLTPGGRSLMFLSGVVGKKNCPRWRSCPAAASRIAAACCRWDFQTYLGHFLVKINFCILLWTFAGPSNSLLNVTKGLIDWSNWFDRPSVCWKQSLPCFLIVVRKTKNFYDCNKLSIRNNPNPAEEPDMPPVVWPITILKSQTFHYFKSNLYLGLNILNTNCSPQKLKDFLRS